MNTSNQKNVLQRNVKVKDLVILGVATAVAVFLSNKQNRIKTKGKMRDMRRAITTPSIEKNHLPINKAGNPDPLDVEDNKMVDEGSMYSVNYYNKKKQ
ncbi:hypothetical protein [Fictibacillus sp. 18YEL24]|uniref:hypothetical protein n=1 Tax=Fictibacillus sp. 18YEL24 TaxID=2745875 RepID=UPI0018CD0C19|nr:hypothetical protein [Fictibacillus sp. 18YEL24]MBH0171474.1 hypothetical protein [Fictibacillus sp. 18YEL24]